MTTLQCVDNADKIELLTEDALRIRDHDQAQREEISRLLQAVGLASTLKPDMEIDVNDPVGMMVQVHQHVLKQREEIARLREALESIAASTCCGSCQEAKLVAQAALAGKEEHNGES